MQKGVATTPTVAEMLVIPVAGHDGILLNLSGECRNIFSLREALLSEVKLRARNDAPWDGARQHQQRNQRSRLG